VHKHCFPIDASFGKTNPEHDPEVPVWTHQQILCAAAKLMRITCRPQKFNHACTDTMNVESYRRRTALARKKPGPGRTAQHATLKKVESLTLSDNQTET
jgi:hypothetical protein